MEQTRQKEEQPLTFKELKDEMARLAAIATRHQERLKGNGAFIMHTANEWIALAQKMPIPKQLFRELWHSGEVCILFADSNTGKSILAVQIGNTIAQQEPVLYFDFELSAKQFEARYSDNFKDHYEFAPGMRRLEIDPDMEVPEGMLFEEHLAACMERIIAGTSAKIVIVDNITYMRQETEQAKDALPLMKQLKTLKNKYGLSMLVLAHTPKRDATKPITRNDLQGSKMLMNFCDSAFVIGESASDSSIRYIKQIKARNTEVIYDSDNVMVTQIIKKDSYLQFEFMGYGTEWEHLQQKSDDNRSETEAAVLQLLASEPNLSAYAIAQRLCPDETKFASYKIKVLRIINRINSNS